jgi:hypothetical protein
MLNKLALNHPKEKRNQNLLGTMATKNLAVLHLGQYFAAFFSAANDLPVHFNKKSK